LREIFLEKRLDETAHEVRDSLEVLVNLVYLIRHSLADEAKAMNYLDMAVTQLHRLDDLSGI
jgi:hypothetical protein